MPRIAINIPFTEELPQAYIASQKYIAITRVPSRLSASMNLARFRPFLAEIRTCPVPMWGLLRVVLRVRTRVEVEVDEMVIRPTVQDF